MRKLLASVALLALPALTALTACGWSGGDSATTALRDTARKLDDVRSARLELRMTAESAAAKPVGFALSGPFSLPEKGGLPTADVELTELRGERRTTVRFVSTGTEAYVVRAGRATRLPSTGGLKVGGDGGGLGDLRIDGWLRDPRVADGGQVGGVATDRISAGLNVARAFDDLGRLGERLGTSALAAIRPLDERSRQQLDRAARDSSVEVWTGRADRLLRRLVIRVTLTPAGDLPEGLRSLVPVTLALTMDLSAVNEPVKVDPPAT